MKASSIGKRFKATANAPSGKLSKLERRMLRRQGMRASSKIERSLSDGRRVVENAASMATNSHEAKRHVEADRLERTATTVPPTPPTPGVAPR